MECRRLKLIELERKEQIEKHKWVIEHDLKHINNELEYAAIYLLTGDIKYFPDSWNMKWFKKFKSKVHGDSIERFKIAGALLAAEINRILISEERESDF